MSETQAVTVRRNYSPPTGAQIDALLIAIESGATVAGACAHLSLRYKTIWQRTKSDSEFAERVEAAKAKAAQPLIEMARKIALGVEVPVYHAGEIVGVKTEIDTKALLFLLGKLIPEFADKRTVEVSGAVEHRHVELPSQLSPQLIRNLPPATQIEVRRAIVEDAFARSVIDAERRELALAGIAVDGAEMGVDVGAPSAWLALPTSNVVDAEFTESGDDGEWIPPL